MTSSLVGSEMCIRDRSASVSMSGISRLTIRERVPWAGNSTSTHSLAACAVSYTHLTLPTICSV
eukprot:12112526-Prorocentrum_lima.AAC.1